ncbi:MAG: glutathione synthase, partial [Gammaproteobacteria bacterium]|nr:glutathione synthase [Gammaproteobacteria bacterium]
MGIKLGIVMDPIDAITTYKDSSFAMLLETQKRGYQLYYMELKDLSLRDGKAFGRLAPLTEDDNQ